MGFSKLGLREMSVSVAVLPPVLRFTPDETKQILTLFNANNFAVKFKLLCTTRDGFQCSHYKGELDPNRRIDIAVRARKLCLSTSEQLRVQYESVLDRTASSFKNIPLILDEEKPPEPRNSKKNLKKEPSNQMDHQKDNHYYYIFVVVLCLAVLSESSYLPDFSTSHRLIAAYVLGMMTILLIRFA